MRRDVKARVAGRVGATSDATHRDALPYSRARAPRSVTASQKGISSPSLCPSCTSTLLDRRSLPTSPFEACKPSELLVRKYISDILFYSGFRAHARMR